MLFLSDNLKLVRTTHPMDWVACRATQICFLSWSTDIVKIMDADDLATQGGRASATMILT